MNRYKYIDEKKEHLHTLDGKPLIGTSSVAGVLAKPLTWWASGLAVKQFGVTDGKMLTLIKNKKATEADKEAMFRSLNEKFEQIKGMDIEEYFKLCDSAYRAHQTTLKDKAQEGTDLHAELERFVKDEMSGEKRLPEAYHARIKPFIEWARTNIKRYIWSEGHCYSEKHFIGGISDLGFEDIYGKFAIMDFKSSKEAYMSQYWQCSGYAIQIQENGILDPDGNTIVPVKDIPDKFDYYSILPFGMENPVPQIFFDTEGAKEAFLAEVLLYRKLPRD